MPALDDKSRTMLFYGWSKFRSQHVRNRNSSRSASLGNTKKIIKFYFSFLHNLEKNEILPMHT